MPLSFFTEEKKTGLSFFPEEEEEPSWLSRILGVGLKEKVPLIEATKGLLPKREVEPIPQFPAGFQPAEAVTTRVERPPVSPESVLRVPTEEERRTGLFARPAIRAAEPERTIEPLGSAISKRIEKVLQPGESGEENAIKDIVRFAYGIPGFIGSVGTGLLDAVTTADTFEELMDNIVSPIGRAGGEMAEDIRKWFEIVSYQISPLEGRGGYEKYERDLEEFNQTPFGPAISLWVAKGVAKQVGRIPKTKRITEVTDYMKAQASRLKETPKVVSEAPLPIGELIKPKEKIYGKAEMEFAKRLKEEGVTEKPVELPAELKPGVMGGVRSVGQEASVQRVVSALKEAKPLRGEQEILYTKERGVRLAKSLAIRKKTTGEAGFYAERAQFKGEMSKVEFESIRSKISQTDIDNLFNKVRDSAHLTEFEKLTTREGLAKMFGEHGGRVPTKGELTLLEQVFPLEFIETVMAKRPLWTKIKEAGWQLANIPRSVMASFDLSFGGRQGAYAAPRYRREFFSAWKKQFKIFGSEKAYQASREALTKHPDFMFAKESKISFTELGKIMTQREEVFMSQWAEKIPLVGRGIRASSRAYTSFANQFRMDIFSRMVKDAETLRFNPRKNPYLARQIADFVNNATGRGSLGSFENAAVALNAIFFSPRLNMARMRLLNPAYYIRQPKFVRTQALKTALTASGTAVTVLTLAELTPGVEAGWNPLSADFGKIKIRNTRLDILAGFGQFMRAGAQLITGKTISTVTGKETILGEGYKPRTRWDIVLQQIEYKESPIASFATTLLKGKDFAGKDVSIPKEVGRRFIPMVIADMIELVKEDPQLLPLGIPAVFGMGLQTYAHPYAGLAKAEKEHGFMSEEWKKVRDKIEESGFKYKYKKYLEYKKGELPSESTPGLFDKYKTGAAPPGGGTVGMGLIPVFQGISNWLKQKLGKAKSPEEREQAYNRITETILPPKAKEVIRKERGTEILKFINEADKQTSTQPEFNRVIIDHLRTLPIQAQIEADTVMHCLVMKYPDTPWQYKRDLRRSTNLKARGLEILDYKETGPKVIQETIEGFKKDRKTHTNRLESNLTRQATPDQTSLEWDEAYVHLYSGWIAELEKRLIEAKQKGIGRAIGMSGDVVRANLVPVFEKITNLIKQNQEQGFIKPQPKPTPKKLPDTPTGKIPYFTEQLVYTKNHPEVADSLVAFAKEINFDEVAKITDPVAKANKIGEMLKQLGFLYPKESVLNKIPGLWHIPWHRHKRLHKAPIKERKIHCSGMADLFWILGRAAGLDIEIIRNLPLDHVANLLRVKISKDKSFSYFVDATPLPVTGVNIKISGPIYNWGEWGVEPSPESFKHYLPKTNIEKVWDLIHYETPLDTPIETWKWLFTKKITP